MACTDRVRSRNERTVRQKPRGESWPTGAFARGGLCPRGHTGAADVAGAARAAQRKQTTESRGPHASVTCTRHGARVQPSDGRTKPSIRAARLRPCSSQTLLPRPRFPHAGSPAHWGARGRTWL